MTTTVAPVSFDISLPQALRRSRLMTACECAGVAFVDIARQLFAEGHPLSEVLERTGCGQTCTACLPDLHAFLSGGDD